MEKMTVYVHPTCSTCKKVLQWLTAHQYDYHTIDIRQTPPPQELFLSVLNGGIARTHIMNTSGELYRELQLKDKVPSMTNEDLAQLLSQEGMLIKRPVICYNERVTFGAKENLLEENWR